jgi:hypothetical protein
MSVDLSRPFRGPAESRSVFVAHGWHAAARPPLDEDRQRRLWPEQDTASIGDHGEGKHATSQICNRLQPPSMHPMAHVRHSSTTGWTVFQTTKHVEQWYIDVMADHYDRRLGMLNARIDLQGNSGLRDAVTRFVTRCSTDLPRWTVAASALMTRGKRQKRRYLTITAPDSLVPTASIV